MTMDFSSLQKKSCCFGSNGKKSLLGSKQIFEEKSEVRGWSLNVLSCINTRKNSYVLCTAMYNVKIIFNFVSADQVGAKGVYDGIGKACPRANNPYTWPQLTRPIWQTSSNNPSDNSCPKNLFPIGSVAFLWGHHVLYFSWSVGQSKYPIRLRILISLDLWPSYSCVLHVVSF